MRKLQMFSRNKPVSPIQLFSLWSYTFLGKKTSSLETTDWIEMVNVEKEKKSNHQTILFWFMIAAGVDELNGNLNNEWKRQLVIF